MPDVCERKKKLKKEKKEKKLTEIQWIPRGGRNTASVVRSELNKDGRKMLSVQWQLVVGGGEGDTTANEEEIHVRRALCHRNTDTL